jgi:hypothetical protein
MICIVLYAIFFVLCMALISLFSCFVHCSADTETNALGLYHKIRGLYLMLSWLVLVTNFKILRSFSFFMVWSNEGEKNVNRTSFICHFLRSGFSLDSARAWSFVGYSQLYESKHAIYSYNLLIRTMLVMQDEFDHFY